MDVIIELDEAVPMVSEKRPLNAGCGCSLVASVFMVQWRQKLAATGRLSCPKRGLVSERELKRAAVGQFLPRQPRTLPVLAVDLEALHITIFRRRVFAMI